MSKYKLPFVNCNKTWFFKLILFLLLLKIKRLKANGICVQIVMRSSIYMCIY